MVTVSLRTLLIDRIRAGGPLTVAEYMELVLYHPQLGYYSRVRTRSGRTGDFFTSVDLGPVFGEMLAVQIAEMHRLMTPRAPHPGERWFELVEAGAGDGQLSRDLLDAAVDHHPELYGSLRLHLVERSPVARQAQTATLGPHAHLLASQDSQLPDRVVGVILANELLDALPAHLVEMREEGLCEIYVDARGADLVERPGPPSTPELASYLERVGARLAPGWRAEVSLAAIRWVREVARRLRRGFLLLIDYGHEATELYSATHAGGTLVTYRDHRLAPPSVREPAWLADPGERDITLHVDLTSTRQAATSEHLRPLGMLDQTYFLLGLGAADRLSEQSGDGLRDIKRRLALKTLLLPGGLGSTHKVLMFGKEVGSPALRGCSYRERLT